MDMTWEEKLAALKALSECTLNMRRPGDWYVFAHIEIGGDGLLTGGGGNGDSPADAVLNAWKRWVTELPADRYLVVNAMGNDRRQYRWNGFMWKDVPLTAVEARA